MFCIARASQYYLYVLLQCMMVGVLYFHMRRKLRTLGKLGRLVLVSSTGILSGINLSQELVSFWQRLFSNPPVPSYKLFAPSINL